MCGYYIMIQERLWELVEQFEVVSRLTLTYMVRAPEDLANKRRRDQGVEYNLQQWVRLGKLHKRPIGNLMAYYLPTGKPGIRGNLEHDCLAGLAAAKLYADLGGRVQVALVREAFEGLFPDWTLVVEFDEPIRYFLEFHSAKNPRRELVTKLETYNQRLGDNDWLLVICQQTTFVELPSEQMMLTTLSRHLATGTSWTDPIWYWGGHDGRFGLLSG